MEETKVEISPAPFLEGFLIKTTFTRVQGGAMWATDYEVIEKE